MNTNEPTEAERSEARRRRLDASRKYQPKKIRLLLVAEAPPADLERYFFFADAGAHDPLFDFTGYVLFEQKPEGDKTPFLEALRRRGVFVTELKPDDPIGDEDHKALAQWLPLRVETLAPEKVIVIGPKVYDAARPQLAAAKLPLVERRIHSADPAHEQEFVREFRGALVAGGLEKLIKPLAPGRPKAQ